jgi:hypothetical protein
MSGASTWLCLGVLIVVLLARPRANAVPLAVMAAVLVVIFFI